MAIPASSGSSGPTNPDKEFGCRSKLVASLPWNEGIDGCDEVCTDGSVSGGGNGIPRGDGTIGIGLDGGCGGGVDPTGGDCEAPGSPPGRRFGVLCILNGEGRNSGGGGGGVGRDAGCSGCLCGYIPSIGSKTVQLGAPNSGPMAPQVLFTYNALSTESTFYGYGFSERNVRWIEELDSTTAEVHRGDGRVFTFGNKDGNGDYTPPPGANSRLQKQGSTWIETRPDGFQLDYNSSGDMVKTTSASGSITTFSYTAHQPRLETIIDPCGGRTTYAYEGSLNKKIKSITDPAGRVTEFKVDSNNDLIKFLRRLNSVLPVSPTTANTG